MELAKSLVEHAFDLARGGSCRNVKDVRKKLRKLGLSHGQIEDHLMGQELREQLARLCRESDGSKTG